MYFCSLTLSFRSNSNFQMKIILLLQTQVSVNVLMLHSRCTLTLRLGLGGFTAPDCSYKEIWNTDNYNSQTQQIVKTEGESNTQNMCD